MSSSDPPLSPNLKPIATRPRDGRSGSGDLEAGGSPPSSSGIVTPKGRAAAELASESPAMGSDSSSPWRRFFRGGSKYPASDVDSYGNSPRNLMGFSPKAGSSASQRWVGAHRSHTQLYTQAHFAHCNTLEVYKKA
jgi:hypothetical protein